MPYVTVKFGILRGQGGVWVEYFYDLWRRSRYEAKLFRFGTDTESKKWDSVHLCTLLRSFSL